MFASVFFTAHAPHFHSNLLNRNKMAESTLINHEDIAEVRHSSSDTKEHLPPDAKRKDRFVGNVSNCIPLPEGFQGPVIRGNLIFNACFEGGKHVILILVKLRDTGVIGFNREPWSCGLY